MRNANANSYVDIAKTEAKALAMFTITQIEQHRKELCEARIVHESRRRKETNQFLLEWWPLKWEPTWLLSSEKPADIARDVGPDFDFMWEGFYSRDAQGVCEDILIACGIAVKSITLCLEHARIISTAVEATQAKDA